MEELKIKARDFLTCDKESIFPCFFTYKGAFKFYEARSASQHPQDSKEELVLIDAYCKKRDMDIKIQLLKDMDVEIYDGVAGEWPE